MTIPGMRATLKDDLYVVLVNWEPISTVEATFKVFHNPLVTWLWVGSGLFIFGAIVAILPTQRKQARV